MTEAPAQTPLIDEDLSQDLATAALALARRFHAGATLWWSRRSGSRTRSTSRSSSCTR